MLNGLDLATGHRHLHQRQRALRVRDAGHGQPCRHHAHGQRRDAATVAELALYLEKRRPGRRQRGHHRPVAGAVGFGQRGAGALPVLARPARAHRRAARRPGCRCAGRAGRHCRTPRAALHGRAIDAGVCRAQPPAVAAAPGRALQALGVPLHRMPSSAGHDAMKLHEVMPQAMLFVRGLNGGISHNPLESTTSDDMPQLAVDAFTHVLNQIATETP
ncbi:MAG: M20/M25/M40 family metallo-hydrolase [Paenacidovorax caeni]